MSRLTNKPVLDGDPINAASLNTRFSGFTQTTLNEFNVRDAAFDLPQFTAAKFMAPQMAIRQIGNQDWKHAAYNTVAGQVTGDVAHIIRDAALAPTDLALGGLAGFTVNTDQLLRVYWDLSVRPVWTSSAPWVGTDVEWTFTDVGGTGTAACSNGSICWAFWLQWDTTDATLTNFTNVPTQESFNTVVTSGRGGNLLSNSQATSVVPAVNQIASAPNGGRFNSPLSPVGIGWTSVDGAWHFKPGSPITIYGLRLVCTGPLAAYHAASNYLLRVDPTLAADAELYYNGGSLQALVMRLQ
jgi:hypothetical protein